MSKFGCHCCSIPTFVADMLGKLPQRVLQPRVVGFERTVLRHFSGRRARKVTRDQVTSQENLLLQQRLKEMEMQMQMQQQVPRKQGFLTTIKEGLLHGIGWSFAQRMVDSIFGPRTLNISDFTGGANDSGSDSPGFMNGSGSSSPFAEENGQDSGWSWGNDLFNDEE